MAVLFTVMVPALISGLLINAGTTINTATTTTPNAAARPLDAVPSGTAAQAASAVDDPAYPYTGYLKWTITGISPTVVTSASGNVLTVSGVVTNVSKGTLYDLRYVWQRGDALSGVAAIKTEIATPSRPSAVIDQDWRILAPKTATTEQTDLAPGASTAYLATVAITDSDGLDLSRRGVYPLMIKISGDIGQNGAVQYERVGEIHLLTTVLSPPAGPVVGSTGIADPTASPSSPAASHPIALNLLWPLVDIPHIGVEGVFLNDNLTSEIKPGGRLYGVLAAMNATNTGASSTTVVIDPELLDEIEQMSLGYRVVTVPGRAQAALTPSSATTTPTGTSPQSGTSSLSKPPGARTTATTVPHPRTSPTSASKTPPRSAATPRPATSSTRTTTPSTTSTPPANVASGTAPSGSPTVTTGTPTSGGSAVRPPPANTVQGTGQRAAIAFLATLRQAMAGRQVLVLPYSDPDSVAMIRAGLDDQLANLIARGRAVAARVLAVRPDQTSLITDMSMPEGGAVNDATLAFLSAHGMSRSLLSAATVQHAGGAVGSVVVDETANQGTVVKAAVTDADLLAGLRDLVAKGNAAGLPTRLSNMAALLTGGSLDGTGTPLVIAPDNRWTPNTVGLGILSGLLRTLQGGGVLTGTSVSTIAASATTLAKVAYPAVAEQAELDPGYLAAVLRETERIAGVASSLTVAATQGAPKPADILDPLSAALVVAGSAGLRTDGRVGRAILRTTESTLDKLRAGVTIAGGTSYTLAASTSPLLVTVRNDLPYVVKVRVTIVGGAAAGMTATDPGVQSIPAGRSQQFKIETKVVKAGKFQVDAQLLAADGSDWSDSTTITVNSTAYGALTIVLIVVAGGALFLMVAIRIVQRVRAWNAQGSAPSLVGARSTHPEPDSILGAANDPSQPAGQWAAERPGNPPAPGASADDHNTAEGER